MPTKGFERFLERMQPLVGEEEWEAFVKGVSEPMGKSVRKRRSGEAGKRGRDEVDVLGWTLKGVGGIEEAFLVDRKDRGMPIGKTLPHFSGEVYVQSLSSMLPVVSLNPQPGEKILDMCSAPGSKTTFLADRMQGEGLIVANEMSGGRIKKLEENLDRMGTPQVVVTQLNGVRLPEYYAQEFDKVLLDAPCSSEGHGRKDSKYFQKTWSEKVISQAAKLQKKLIEAAFLVLREGGELVYSTCTMAPEENELVVQWLVDEYGDYLEILPHGLSEDIPFRGGVDSFCDQKIYSEIQSHAVRIWPHRGTESFSSEAFFLVKIRKTKALSLSDPPRKGEGGGGLHFLPKNQKAEKEVWLSKVFGLPRELWKGIVFFEDQKALFLTTQRAFGWAQKHKVRRVGLPVIDAYGFLTSPFVVHYGSFMNKNIVQINKSQQQKWMEGGDVDLEEVDLGSCDLKASQGQCVVQYEGYSLGMGKVLEDRGVLKNRLDVRMRWS